MIDDTLALLDEMNEAGRIEYDDYRALHDAVSVIALPAPDADVAERIGAILREHQPTSGMQVASGVTCRCGYWASEERPGVTRPVGYSGLMWHQAQMIATPPVAIEVEWEWHLRDEGGDIWTGPFASEEQAQAARRESRPHWIVVRRRRAGPWIEVPPVAATGEGADRG